MQPLSRQRLTANPYRVLGLPAGASQAAIDAAARRMRIWSDPRLIPPTDLDLPWMGPVPRTKNDLEQAVARLNAPESRLQERLLWFADPVHLAGARPQTLDRLAAELAKGASDAAQRHAAALAQVHAALAIDPQVHDAARWQRAMAALADVARSEESVAWVERVEREGEFEKRASRLEVVATVRGLADAAAAMLGQEAEAALERGDVPACSRLTRALKAAAGAPGTSAAIAAAECEARIVDRLEDVLRRRCELLFEEFCRHVRCDRNNFDGNKAHNNTLCLGKANEYNDVIVPLLTELQALAADDRERVERSRAAAGKVLGRIGLGWVWAGQYLTADRTFSAALELARGTRLEREIQANRQENAERARRQQQRPGLFSNPRFGKGGGGKKAQPWWIVVIAISALARGLTSGTGSSGTNTPDISPPPSFRTPTFPKIDDDVWRRLREQQQQSPWKLLPETQPTTPEPEPSGSGPGGMSGHDNGRP